MNALFVGWETKMKKLAFAIVLCATLGSSSAFAQTALPSTRPNLVSVQQDAVLSSKLIGLDVYDGANDKVGVITDLILEKSDLAGYILSVGGLLGVGDHYVAVSPGSIGYAYNDADKKWKATINVTKDDLKAAPQFFYEGKFKR